MLVINRLGKVTNNSIGQSADSINVIGLGNNDDRGNRVPGIDEVPVEFDPDHRTHIDVSDQQFLLVGCLPLAQMRSGSCVRQCPSLWAQRKTYTRTEFFPL
jgi:hypothetical protein